MAKLDPVSDSHALLESISSVTDMQTCSPSGECNAEPVEDSSKTTIDQFGFSSNSKKQDGRASVWNKWEKPWTQQSSHFEDALTSVPKQPVRKISKHNAGFSGRPKRPPLIWGEHKRFTSERTGDVTSWVGDDQMPEKKQHFSLEGETSSNVPPLYKTESFQNPPDLLAPTGTWSWRTVNEKNESTRFHEQSGNTPKTSRKKWGEAKRWAQNVKERWRERHRNTLTRQRDDGERQVQSEVQVSIGVSQLLVPIDVNDTPTALTETTEIHHEEINTALAEDGPGSLSYMSDSLFSFGTTSNLMEEIFSGTEWARYHSVNCGKPEQSNELPNTNNQSHEEELPSKWTHKDPTDSHLGWTQPPHLESFAQDMASDKQTETSQMSITDLPTNPLQTSDPFIDQSQNINLNPNKSHNSEQSNGQSQFSQLDPNESKATEHSDQQPTSNQVSSPSHNQPEGGTKDFIPLLDSMKRLSLTSHGSLSRKREHWTKRRASFEHTTQDMEDEAQPSNPSAATSLNSLLDSISQDSESSETLETVIKKRRMEDTRYVRFSEEVIILPPSYWPESDDDNDDEENDNDWQEEPSPRPSFPKWIVSLKSRRGKYKFELSSHLTPPLKFCSSHKQRLYFQRQERHRK
uniref:Zgc:113229 n=1 Tax=Sinocyclocheilus grahami TaxID=75366 RepID=A0A672M9R9_SINGR